MKPRLVADTSDSCHRCQRNEMAGKRHKERPGGPWCSGTLTKAEEDERTAKERARAEFMRLRRAYFELSASGRHQDALVLVKNGTRAMHYPLRDVPE